jgi:hypothetical protein
VRLPGEEAALVRRAHLKLCREVRKDAVLLTDALAIPDYVLKAPFGAYDGDIYRKYFAVRHSLTHSSPTHTRALARSHSPRWRATGIRS